MNLQETVLMQLRDLILRGEFEPGHRLAEQQLAERLGASRTPVRAALVTLEQEGCLIVENWVSAQGGQTGTSFNFYDVRDGKWHQLYIDNSGNAGAFPAMAGELKDGRMVLMTDDRVSPVSRWTWYAITPDRVRQMAEQSTDGQKTWQVTWDSYYVRKVAAKN